MRSSADERSKLFMWIDPDQCTGAGLCVDQCPELFIILEDGIACLRGPDGEPNTDQQGAAGLQPVPNKMAERALAAALSCPGECIYLEEIETQSNP